MMPVIPNKNSAICSFLIYHTVTQFYANPLRFVSKIKLHFILVNSTYGVPSC